MNFPKYFQFFIKELNKNRSKDTKSFFYNICKSVNFSSVVILENNIEDEIKNNSRVLLGGDLELSTKNEALDLNFLNELKKNFLITEVIEFSSIIRAENEENKATRIKVMLIILYPLVGRGDG